MVFEIAAVAGWTTRNLMTGDIFWEGTACLAVTCHVMGGAVVLATCQLLVEDPKATSTGGTVVMDAPTTPTTAPTTLSCREKAN